jgi:hypothetical protein
MCNEKWRKPQKSKKARKVGETKQNWQPTQLICAFCFLHWRLTEKGSLLEVNNI